MNFRNIKKVLKTKRVCYNCMNEVKMIGSSVRNQCVLTGFKDIEVMPNAPIQPSFTFSHPFENKTLHCKK